MLSDTIDEILKDLQKFYSKKLNESQIVFYREKLSVVNEGDLCKAVMALKGKEVVLPTVSIVWRYLTEVREQRGRSEKAQAPIFADIQRNSKSTTHGREAVKLLLALRTGDIGREQYLTGMYEMEGKYPGIGWKENADELKTLWDEEPIRHEKGRRYLERIWRLQDANGETSIPPRQ
jgi:hypothetical protein